MKVLPACMLVHHVSGWCPRRPEAGVRLLELELQVLCAIMWILIINLGPP